MAVIELTTWIAASPEACFDLSRSVDAHRGSMEASQERAVAGVTTGLIGLNQHVTWEARHFGRRVRMTSRITRFDLPSSFVDEQVSGPFASWWHEHLFEAESGGTLMTDRVRYTAPVGVMGAVVDRLILRRYMARLLERRNEYLKRSLESPPDSNPPLPS